MAEQPLSHGQTTAFLPGLRRGQTIVLAACIALIVGLAWLYLATIGTSMMVMAPMAEMPMPAAKDAPAADSMAGMSMEGMDMAGMDMGEGAASAMEKAAATPTAPATGGALSFGLLAAMWIVMMFGMMLPSATPMIMMAARVSQARAAGGAAPLAGAGVFALGYLLAWTAFSLVAAAAQTGLQHALLIGAHDMALINPIVSGTVLIAAGAYQWSPLKRLCLTNCRSPMGFLMGRWRPGALNAVRLGASHGLYCLGCCWVLMALLFVAGVMALPWVAALAVFVLLEKVAPKGEWIGRAGGLAMIGAGIYLIVAG